MTSPAELFLALATRRMFSATGAVMSTTSAAAGPGGQLLHVEDGRRVVHRAAVGHRHDGDRVRHALGHQRGAVDRVDGDVALRALAVADLLAVVEHRRLVLLALADDDDAVHAHRADERAHRVDRGAVAAVLVAAADPAAGGHGGRLGDPDQLEGEVAVGRRPVGAEARGSSEGGLRERAATRDLLVGHPPALVAAGGALSCDPRCMTGVGPTSQRPHDPGRTTARPPAAPSPAIERAAPDERGEHAAVAAAAGGDLPASSWRGRRSGRAPTSADPDGRPVDDGRAGRRARRATRCSSRQRAGRRLPADERAHRRRQRRRRATR